MNNRPNDWFATKLFQPDFTIADMYANGITPDNSELKSKDAYRDIPEVQKAFTVNGKFDENKFDQFYNIALSQYNEYSNNEFEKQFIENYARDAYDWTKLDKPIADNSPVLVFGKNPLRTTQGIRNLTQSTESTFSIREIAQANKVHDEKGNILDWTPNDKGGLFKSLSRPTLVLAQWDEDGEHEVDGKMVQHMKGEYKYDEDGIPYYEILGKREMYGKDVLHWTDTLTIDGEGLNHLDFFDSDGKDKSIIGTVAKTTLQIAPLLIPYVGPVYGGIRAAFAVSQLFPTLGKAINGFITNDNENALGRTLTAMENYTARFAGSTSDYARNKMWAFENMANLIGQVGGQLFEQQAIGMIPRLLNKQGNFIKQSKLGRDMATAYMAGTSAQETYSAFKEAGASDRTAGLAMIGNVAAFWKLMQLDYFKDTLFKGSWLDDNLIKEPARNHAKSVAGKVWLKGAEAAADEKAAKEAVKQVSKSFYATMKDYLTNGTFVPRAISEGVEEVMEEITTDLLKGLTEATHALGIVDKDRELDFGWSAKDIFNRYTMSFVGGVIGGGIFQLQNKYNKLLKGETASRLDKDDMMQIIMHVAEGNADEIREYYKKWHDKGWFGSINLSGAKFVQNALPGSKNAILAEADTNLTQNDAIYNLLSQEIDYIEQILNEEGLDKLVDASVKKSIEQQFANLGIDVDDSVKTRIGILSNFGLDNLLTNRLVKLSAEIVELRAEIDKKTKVPKGDTAEDKREADEINANNIELIRLQERLKKLRKERDSWINGEHNDEIVGAGLFAVDTELQSLFINMDKDSFCRTKYGKTYNELSDDQKFTADTEYNQYKKEIGNKEIFRAAEVYAQFSNRYSGLLKQAADTINSSALDRIKPNVLLADYFTELQGQKIKADKELNELNGVTDPTDVQKQRILELQETLEKIQKQLLSIEKTPGSYLNTMFSESSPFYNLQNYLLNSKYIYKDETELANAHDAAKNTDEYKNGTVEERTKIDNEFLISTTIDKISDDILDLYQYYADNNIILNDDNELQNFLQIVKSKSDVKVEKLWDAIVQKVIDYHFPGEGYSMDYDVEESSDMDDWVESFKRDDKSNILTNTTYSVEARHQLFGLLNSLRASIGTGQEEKSEKQLREFLKNNSPLNDDEITLVVESAVPRVNGMSVISYIGKINDLKEKITYSPFNELFSKFTADISGNPVPILDLIDSEIKLLADKERIVDYAIDSQQVYDQLKSTRILLNVFRGLLKGAFDGYNTTLNPILQAVGKNPFAELDYETAKYLNDDALLLDRKIAYLIQLHDSNNESKLKTQKDIAINCRPKLIKSLLSDAFVDSFNKSFNISLRDLWEKHDTIDLDEVNDSNYHEFEKEIIAFETEIFEEVKKLGLTQKDLSKKIISLFGDDVYKMKSTLLSKDKELTITAYDQMINLTSIISLNSNDFYIKLRRIVEDPEFKFAPIFGQELSIRTSVAQALNPQLFNNILYEVKGNAPKDLIEKFNSATEDEKNNILKNNFNEYSDQVYFSQKNILQNCSFVFGGAGVGKTAAIANIIVKFLTDDQSDFILCAPNDTQAKKLTTTVGLNEDKVKTYDKTELLKLISSNNEGIKPENLRVSDDKNNLQLVPIYTGVSYSANSIYDAGKRYHYMIIDEAGQFTSAEWKLISNYAYNHNLIVIALGDLKQSSASSMINGKLHQSGLEDCYMIKSPQLTATLRANNVGKIKNYNTLNTVLSNIYTQYENNPELTTPQLSKLVDNELSSNLVELLHYEDENRIIGEKVVSKQEDIIRYANKISKFSKDIIIYADDPSNPAYQDLKSKGIVKEVLPTINVNGAEYEYVLVDWNWTKNETSENVDKLNVLKDFYTVTQRSTQATVFVNYGLVGDSGILNIKTPVSDPKVNGTVVLSNNDIDAFKNWRLKGLEGLIESSQYAENLSPVGLNEDTHLDKDDSDDSGSRSSSDPDLGPEPKPSSDPDVGEPSGSSGGPSRSPSSISSASGSPSNPSGASSASSGGSNESNPGDDENPRSSSGSDSRESSSGDATLGEGSVLDGSLVPPEINPNASTYVPDKAHEEQNNQRNALAESIKNIMDPNKSHAINTEHFFRDIYANPKLLESDKSNQNSLYSFLKNNEKRIDSIITPEMYAQVHLNAYNTVMRGNDFRENIDNIIEPIKNAGVHILNFIQFIKNPKVTQSIQLVADPSNRRSIIYIQFDDGKTVFRIPLGFSNRIVNGQYNGEFKLLQGIQKRKNRRERLSVNSLMSKYPGLYAYPCVLSVDEAEIEAATNFNASAKIFFIGGYNDHGTYVKEKKDLRDPNTEYKKGNNGKSFVYITTEKGLSESEIIRKLSVDKDAVYNKDVDGTVYYTDYGYSDSKYASLAGIQNRVNASNLIRYAIAESSLQWSHSPENDKVGRKDWFRAWGLIDKDGALAMHDAYAIKYDPDELKQLRMYNDNDVNYNNKIRQITSSQYQALSNESLRKFIPSLFSDSVRTNPSDGVQKINSVLQDNFGLWLHSSEYELIKRLNKIKQHTITFKIKGNTYFVRYNKDTNKYDLHQIINNNVVKDIDINSIKNKTFKATPIASFDANIDTAFKAFLPVINYVKSNLGVPINRNGLDPTTDQMWLSELNVNINNGTANVYDISCNDSIYQLFMNISDQESIDRMFENNPIFTDSIFINNPAGKKYSGTYFRRFIGNVDRSTIDVDELSYPIFILDDNQIVATSKVETFENHQAIYDSNLDFIKDKLKEHHIFYTFNHNITTDTDFLALTRNMVMEINKYISDNITNPINMLQFKLDENNWTVMDTVVNSSQAFVDKLVSGKTWKYAMAKNNVPYKTTWESWNYEIILVNSQDGMQPHIIVHNSITDTWDYRKFNSFTEYLDMMNKLDELNLTDLTDLTIKRKIVNYIMSLQLDEINDTAIDQYINTLNEIDPNIRATIETVINNYLIKRLDNGEC